MKSHIHSATFLYTPNTEKLIGQIIHNSFDTKITPAAIRKQLYNQTHK